MTHLQRKTDVWLQLREKWGARVSWRDFGKVLDCFAALDSASLDVLLGEQREKRKRIDGLTQSLKNSVRATVLRHR